MRRIHVNVRTKNLPYDLDLEINGRYYDEIKETRELPGERSCFKINSIKWRESYVTDILFELFGEDYFEELVLTELEGE